MINKKRKDLCTKTKNGLYPDEILMLHYAHTYTNGQNYFQNFWSFRYGVDNPQELLNSLLSSGYIELGGVADALQDESVKKLKEILTAKCLKATGKKAELITRIIDTCDINELSAQFPERHYKLTPKGENELTANEYVIYIHHKQYDEIGLNIYSLNQLLANSHSTDYKSLIVKHLLSTDKPNYYSAVEILLEDGNYNEALPYIAFDLYRFLSGIPDNYQPKNEAFLYDTFLETNFPYEKSLIQIPTGRIKPLRLIIDRLSIDYDQLYAYLIKTFSRSNQPQLFFTDNECAEIIIYELKSDTERLKEIYARAERKYRAKFE